MSCLTRQSVRLLKSTGYLLLSSDTSNSGKHGNTCRNRKRDSHIGYTTDFEGRFNLDKPLTEAHKAYLVAFASTRHMQRDGAVYKLPDPLREAVNLPAGPNGEYYVAGTDGFDFGSTKNASILDHNSPPRSQPGLWCQWVPSEDGKGIEWDGGEKFYAYTEWLKYIVDNFLKPWGYKLNGTVKWEGEESGDIGKIVVKDNAVTTKEGRVVYR